MREPGRGRRDGRSADGRAAHRAPLFSRAGPGQSNPPGSRAGSGRRAVTAPREALRGCRDQGRTPAGLHRPRTAWQPSPPAARSWPPTTTTGVSRPPAQPRRPAPPARPPWLTALLSPGRLGSASSSSSCGSVDYPGEAIPHPLGLPKADPGHWWASFFFGKSTVPFMATVLETPEHLESSRASSSMVTGGLASEATRKPPLSRPIEASTRPSF